jgi:hypothetical protein
MANNPQNIRLSACSVFFNGNDLGFTVGGVDLTVKTTSTDFKVDHFGYWTVNSLITGRTISVKMALAETDIGSLTNALTAPGMVGIGGSSSNEPGINIGYGGGGLASNNQAVLALIPVEPIDGQNIYIWIPCATLTGDLEMSFKYDTVRTMSVEFTGRPDDNNNIMYMSQGALLTDMEGDIITGRDGSYILV